MTILSQVIDQLPRIAKYIFFLLLALNAHSLPLVWHFRFWWRLGPRYWLVKTQGRQAYIDKAEKRILATGGIRARTISKRRAWVDDCDYNMHLSNSCYAKSADHSMSAWMWDNLPVFVETGGYSALGGTHYTFIREIPILSEYTVETRVVGWGEKWYYLVHEFIIYPKKSTKSPRSKTVESQTPGSTTPAPISPPSSDSGSATPPEVQLPGTDTQSPSKPTRTESPSADIAAQALAALRSPKPRTDGGLVACIAVHELCMKIGRITVPPRIGFYLGGHSTSSSDQAHARTYSSSKKAAAAWVAGGWKTETNAAEIGRDIQPCMSEDLVQIKGSASKDQLERAVRGMESVGTGLGEIVRL